MRRRQEQRAFRPHDSSRARPATANPGRRATAELSQVEVAVHALGGLGDGVARLGDGRVVLVADAVPGDRLQVALEPGSRGIARGRIMGVLEASPDRLEPPCAVAGRCGGCTWQHVALSAQRKAKAELAQHALGKSAPALMIAGDVPLFAWRRRARLHLRHEAGQLCAGLMARASEQLVATATCPVLAPPLEALLGGLAAAFEDLVEQGEVHAVVGVEGVLAAVFARPLPHAPRADVAALANRLGLAGLRLRLGQEEASWGLAEVTLPETAGPLPVRVDAAGFCQATVEGNRAIREAVAAALDVIGKVPRCQEFFAGSGNLGVLLAGRTPVLRCVDWDEAACDRARRALAGAAAKGLQATVLCGDSAELAEPPLPGELWLLDPGRPGARALCEAAARWLPTHVIYVSCALDTLGRDLRILAAAGYRQESAVLIDTFPHTPHCELVVRLRVGADASA